MILYISYLLYPFIKESVPAKSSFPVAVLSSFKNGSFSFDDTVFQILFLFRSISGSWWGLVLFCTWLVASLYLLLVIKHWESSFNYRIWLTGPWQVTNDTMGEFILFTLVSCQQFYHLSFGNSYLCYQVVRHYRT